MSSVVVYQYQRGSLSNLTTTTPRTAPSKKMNLYFTREIRDCLDLFGTPTGPKMYYSFICNDSVQFQMELRKIRPRPHLSGYFRIHNFFFPDTATVHTYPVNSTANPEKKIRSPEWKKMYPQRIR